MMYDLLALMHDRKLEGTTLLTGHNSVVGVFVTEDDAKLVDAAIQNYVAMTVKLKKMKDDIDNGNRISTRKLRAVIEQVLRETVEIK